MQRVLEHLRELLMRRIRYRITRGGILFTLATLIVGTAAVISGANLLFLVLAAMFSTVLVSGLVSQLCLAVLEIELLVPEHIPAGRDVPGRLRVRNRKLLMPSFSIRVEGVEEPGCAIVKTGVYFPLIAAGSELEERVEVRFPRRGTYRQNSFAFTTSFPFGFLEKTARVLLRREMVVYPPLDPQPGFDGLLGAIAGEIESHYRGLGQDFYRIRPYEMFESARHVDWKATAHVGGLQVREFAKEEERTVEIYLDRDVAADLDPWFEHAINCCAFLSWRLAGQGVHICFRAQGTCIHVPQDSDIYTVLKYLALVYPQRGGTPEAPEGVGSFKLVFTPAPNRFADAGWGGARMLSPSVLPAPPAATAARAK